MLNTKKCVYISLFFTCAIFANNASPTIADIVKNIGLDNDTALRLLLEKEKKDLQKKQKGNTKHMAIGAGETLCAVISLFCAASVFTDNAELISGLFGVILAWDGVPRIYSHALDYLKNNKAYNSEAEAIDKALTLLTNITNEENTHD